jgi:hypothetical protein
MIRDLERIDKDLSDPSSLPPGFAGALRLRSTAIAGIIERIRTRCINFTSRVEQQHRAGQSKVDFLASVQNQVDNYFAAHHVDTLRKLQKASDLIGSEQPEDHALLLTAVRRAIKSVADHFFPAVEQPHVCADGKTRTLGDSQYLNRLEEFCHSLVYASSSSELLKAELTQLSVFARRLNDVAAKGVHAEVTATEAKQGILGLYLFLFNLIGRIEQQSESS